MIGQADILDPEGDRLVDGYANGRFDIYLPEVIDEENPEESPSEVELSTQEQEARLSARRTDLISACFTSCRCISEPCACVLDDCTP